MEQRLGHDMQPWTIVDVEESETQARNHAEYLRSNLEEHSLELLVKAANEAEAACQQRSRTRRDRSRC